MNLECSSKGDKRFSAFYARVSVNGVINSIEKVYQDSKRCKGVKVLKGKFVDSFIVNNKTFDAKYLTSWYTLLWIKYLDNNPELVEYAKGFDTFSDMFKGKAINCQADVIRDYVKLGRASLMKECSEFLLLLKA